MQSESTLLPRPNASGRCHMCVVTQTLICWSWVFHACENIHPGPVPSVVEYKPQVRPTTQGGFQSTTIGNKKTLQVYLSTLSISVISKICRYIAVILLEVVYLPSAFSLSSTSFETIFSSIANSPLAERSKYPATLFSTYLPTWSTSTLTSSPGFLLAVMIFSCV